MKVLVFLLALSFPAVLSADPCNVAYKVKATEVVPQSGVRSCGAAQRMLKDRHRIVVRGDKFYVNNMRWATRGRSDLPGEAYLVFHDGQKVWLTLWVMATDRRLIGLYALNAEGCQDLVRVEGYRL